MAVDFFRSLGLTPAQVGVRINSRALVSALLHNLEITDAQLPGVYAALDKRDKLAPEAYRWYVDVRRYGSFPHSGFGLGLERTVAWICGLKHIRETIPFPRMLEKVYP